jgi:hypothetical protein
MSKGIIRRLATRIGHFSFGDGSVNLRFASPGPLGYSLIMILIADMHSHLYPGQNITASIRAAWVRLAEFALKRPEEDQDIPALFLCWVHPSAPEETFPELAAHEWPEEWRVVPFDRGIKLEGEGDLPPLHLLEGRQIATSERLEVLGLGLQVMPPEKLTCTETIQYVLDQGGIPVLPWAVGKWMLTRKDVVSDQLTKFTPRQLLIGDSALRPKLWPESGIFKDARDVGFRVVAGSDPLPLPGEEERLGTYVTSFLETFTAAPPWELFRDTVLSRVDATSVHGSRLSLPLLIRQWLRHWWLKRQQAKAK